MKSTSLNSFYLSTSGGLQFNFVFKLLKITIGITTPRGQVGSQIVKQLLQQNEHDIILLDNKSEQSKEIMELMKFDTQL